MGTPGSVAGMATLHKQLGKLSWPSLVQPAVALAAKGFRLTEKEAIELLEAKIEKEANRYIQHWPEESISVENGRWGPFIKFGKAMVNLPKIDGGKMTADQCRTLTLADVKAMIEKELPGAFDVKKKAPAKKAAPKAKKK